MRRLGGILFAVVMVAVLATQVFAADTAVAFPALEKLQQFYPDPVDSTVLLNAALRGAGERLEQVGCVNGITQMPGGSDYAKLYIAQRESSLASCPKLSELDFELAATAAMLRSLDDSHTFLILPARAAELRLTLQGKAGFSGVGLVSVCRDGTLYVRDIFVNGPAFKAGLRRFDRIVRIGDWLVECRTESDLLKVVSLLRGSPGTPVEVLVRRAGVSGDLVISIVRAPIQTPTIEYMMLNGTVGYLHLREFNAGSSRLFSQVFGSLVSQGMQQLIFDLRGNPGGYIVELENILSMLLPSDLPILRRRSRDGESTDFTLGGPSLNPDVKLMVLVDENSASASEITAAALQEHRRAVIVGAKTAGAVEAAQRFDLPGGAMIELTVQRLWTGLGNRLEKIGVTPNYIIELTNADFEAGRDSQLEFVLRLLFSQSFMRPQGLFLMALMKLNLDIFNKLWYSLFS